MDIESARSKMIRQLAREITDRKVLDAMSRIPRERFVPAHSRHLAYDNMPLPIDMGQTISQPLIVALMTEALELEGNEKVLELGTGSGYQTAILCDLARWVVSVERHQELIDRAEETLSALGCTNVEIHLAGKTLGWRKEAPYEAIMVTAGAPNVAQELLDQLAVGGRLVIPVGTPFEQDLMKIVKHATGLESANLGPCRFVPLIGEGGWQDH
jgi:protein-L-isoaspartate(D-aspartate) O-methyltransferase